MSTLHHPSGGFPLDPQSEGNELRDIGARDLSPTPCRPAAWDDLDRGWAEEMERQDRGAAFPVGHCETACEACGAAVGEALCDSCRRAGEALVAEL